MKIIINESQLRLIVENEEYINSIKELINTFDPNNIDMAFQIMKGMKIKQSVILDEYKELFEIFKLKPSKLNLIKMGSRTNTYLYRESVPDILFKMPNLEIIRFGRIKNLDNLHSFKGVLLQIINTSDLDSGTIPNLVEVGGGLKLNHTNDYRIKSLPMLSEVGKFLDLSGVNIKSLPMLKYVGTNLDLSYSSIESLPNGLYVGGDLFLYSTPLSKATTEEELRSKINVKGDIYL